MRTIRPFLLSVLTLVLASPAVTARIISYAPVTSNYTRPAIQKRDASRFLLVESPQPFLVLSNVSAGPGFWSIPLGELVLHDPSGAEEPVVVLSRLHEADQIDLAAMNETEDGRLHLLALTNAVSGVHGASRYLYSGDGGSSWRTLDVPENLSTSDYFRADVGSPVVRGRGAQVRLGEAATPFIFAASDPQQPAANTFIFAVDAGGSVRKLTEMAASPAAMIIGSDSDGDRVLIAGRPIVGGTARPAGLHSLGSDGSLHEVLQTASIHSFLEGWITASGSVYLEESSPASQTLSLIDDGAAQVLDSRGAQSNNGPTVFAVPTHDFEGAWVVSRQTGRPTTLQRHTPAGGFETMWSDVAGPEVEAIHTAASGERLLIQVHRERTQEVQFFIDPALAIWEMNAPAPRRYDELFLVEGPAKGFVSLDVDAVAAGGSFVFDSAPTEMLPPPDVSAGIGGGEVSQEWGVVRASLQQRLVLPAIARLEGAYDSFWKSDVIFWNDEPEPVRVTMRYVPQGGGASIESDLILPPKRVRLVQDALLELFGLETGGGALFLDPEPGRAIAVTSRLYAVDEKGSYGMGVNAIDVFAASSSRFFLTYAGAFQGAGMRTNLLVTDAGGHGVRFGLQASGPTGPTGRTDLAFQVPPGGQVQINDVGARLGVYAHAAARFETLRGQAIASLVTNDNRTNDPTLFPPDVTASIPRTIPFIGHLDGANGSKFRTDLYLFNAADEARFISLAAKPLESDAAETRVDFMLLPREAKTIPDAYKLAFGREGLGRLRFWSSGSELETEGVRVSARIYTEEPDGGTYGFVMPALNALQAAGPGETLVILGAVIDPRFRTNLALVETAPWAQGTAQSVEVEIFGPDGTRLDRFQTSVRSAGGAHLLDLFGSRGLTAASPTPVVIRVTPSVASLGAFATMVDNGTNDPLYLGAALDVQ